jgi:hypothetical protein
MRWHGHRAAVLRPQQPQRTSTLCNSYRHRASARCVRGLESTRGRRHRPWLSVDGRWLPMCRARRGHGRGGRRGSELGDDGRQLARWVRPVQGDHFPRWQASISRRGSTRLHPQLGIVEDRPMERVPSCRAAAANGEAARELKGQGHGQEGVHGDDRAAGGGGLSLLPRPR